MDDDWDLQAVVKGVSATATTTTHPFAVGVPSFSTFPPPPPQLAQAQRVQAIETLHDIYNSFFSSPPSPPPPPPPHPLSPPASPLSVLGGSQDPSSQQQQQVLPPQQVVPQKQLASSSVGVPRIIPHTQIPKPKKRKNQMRQVCQVPAERVFSDQWSWRKYGQKPIKGSPYPRGYYRCSTSKGCLARKQVERNRSDPTMFIVTYTAEHNHPMPTHRNSLAGSSRQKPGTPQAADNDDPNKPAEDLPTASEDIEGAMKAKDDNIEGEDDDDLGISDMPVDEQRLFAGPSPAQEGSLSDYFPATNQFPWSSESPTTAAGGSS